MEGLMMYFLITYILLILIPLNLKNNQSDKIVKCYIMRKCFSTLKVFYLINNHYKNSCFYHVES